MLIEGGYDPYSEKNISITPIFLQKDLKSLDILLEHCYLNSINNLDIVLETLLFKPCINEAIIEVFDENGSKCKLASISDGVHILSSGSSSPFARLLSPSAL